MPLTVTTPEIGNGETTVTGTGVGIVTGTGLGKDTGCVAWKNVPVTATGVGMLTGKGDGPVIVTVPVIGRGEAITIGNGELIETGSGEGETIFTFCVTGKLFTPTDQDPPS